VARALDLDEAARTRLAAAAKARARLFSRERMCADTLAVYREVLGLSAPAESVDAAAS
jgi:glycosyltransferase involved in cell wall biosynthesis